MGQVNGYTALFAAAENGQVAVVDRLIAAGCKKEEYSVVRVLGCTHCGGWLELCIVDSLAGCCIACCTLASRGRPAVSACLRMLGSLFVCVDFQWVVVGQVAVCVLSTWRVGRDVEVGKHGWSEKGMACWRGRVERTR